MTTPSSPPAALTAEGTATPADVIAAAVRAVPGVVDLYPGEFGEVATYLPGRRVHGVRIRDDHTQVDVVATWGSALAETADRVRAAVTPLVSTPVVVHIGDVAAPDAAPVTTPSITHTAAATPPVAPPPPALSAAPAAPAHARHEKEHS